MTNLEKVALQSCADRLESLASLENAGFSFSKEEDERIKKAIEPYMMWFDMIAENLRYIVKLDEEKDKWWKKHELEEIIRYNH